MFLHSLEVRILIFLLFFIASSWVFLTVPNLSNPKLVYFSLFGVMGAVILYVGLVQK
ncbi:MAG: hypothetical protein JNM39_11805 [Bdellovibrionaceae bacterium]|nr:hypothetical protein [Pseudobdellovibrionaceae bacterium]